MDLEDYGIDLESLKRMYAEYLAGATKSGLELKYLDNTTGHGKVFSSLVRRYLHIETEKRSSLSKENARLKAVLRDHGINPGRPGTSDIGEKPEQAEFYAYVDMEPHEVSGLVARIVREVVEPLQADGRSDVTVTLEVRASVPRPVPEGLAREVLGAVFELGFLTYEFEE